MSEKEAALGVVQGVIDAMNKGENTVGLAGLNQDVVIIDDVRPFRRSGHLEAELWFRRLSNGRNRLNASLGLKEVDVRVSEDRAYVVAPGVLNGSLNDTSFGVDGTVTATLVRNDGSWLVDTLIWSSGR